MFISMANKFMDNENIQFLKISVDSSYGSWKDFLGESHVSENLTELFIKDGMRNEFGRKFSIGFVPRYILIDKQGKIVNANLEGPGVELEALLNELLLND